MHDMDRVSMQRENEFESEAFEFEGSGETESQFSPRWEARRSRAPLSETEALELAAELLSLSNEQELEQFLGGVLDRAATAVRGAIDSPTGQAVISALKPVAKAVIPAAGAALGGALGGAISEGVGAPLGASLGGAVGDYAVRALGMELEGLSHEDREFEVAKQVVRLAAATAANAASAPSHVPPEVVAKAALEDAAKQFAPGLLSAHGVLRGNGHGLQSPDEHADYGHGGAASGRWFRRGNKIVIVGA